MLGAFGLGDAILIDFRGIRFIRRLQYRFDLLIGSPIKNSPVGSAPSWPRRYWSSRPSCRDTSPRLFDGPSLARRRTARRRLVGGRRKYAPCLPTSPTSPRRSCRGGYCRRNRVGHRRCLRRSGRGERLIIFIKFVRNGVLFIARNIALPMRNTELMNLTSKPPAEDIFRR